MTFPQAGLVLVPLVAVLAPLLARAVSRWVRVPIVVFELVLGILIGPSVLRLVHPSDLLDFLADFGLAVLFFVAGSEIDFRAIAGRPISRSVVGWIASLVIGVGIGFLIAPGEAAIFIAIALSSTALGTILPILRDAGELGTPFGRAVSALGAVGEFGPLIAISIFLGTRDIGISTLVLVGFVLLAGLAMWGALRVPKSRFHRFVSTTIHTSGQFAVRVIILVIAALVTLSVALDLDMLLGAFVAGILWKIVMVRAPERDRRQVDSKMEAIAFGFVVPIFFVYTGVTFDVAALAADPANLLLVPVFLVVLLVSRGLPAQLAAPPGSGPRDRAALGLFAATGLPIIVAVTSIGVDEGVLSSGHASVLVAAGMLSVLLYPLIAMAVRPAAADETPAGRAGADARLIDDED